MRSEVGVYVADIGKPLGAQQRLADILRGPTDDGFPGEPDAGGLQFAADFVGLCCGFGDDGMIAKSPSAEMASQAIARKTERIVRTLSGGRSVMRAKRADCGSTSCKLCLSFTSAA